MRKYFFLIILLLVRSLGVAQTDSKIVLPKLSEERVTLHTSVGDMVIGFFPEVAPNHTQQLLQWFRQGHYNGVAINSIFPHDFAQTENSQESSEIQGLPEEPSPTNPVRGFLSMSQASKTSLRFILGENPKWSGKDTVFGAILGGFNVLEELEKVPLDGDGHPKLPVRILSTEVSFNQEMPPPAPVVTEQAQSWFMVGLMITMMSIAIFIAFWGSRFSHRVVASLSMLITLVGAFGLFAILGNMSAHLPWLGIIIFFGLTILFRFLGKFESPGFKKTETLQNQASSVQP